MSIRQNAYPDAVPDFRNLGVMARVLVGVNLLVLAAALFTAANVRDALESFVNAAAFIEPLLLGCLAALALVSPWLARLPYWIGSAAVLGLVLAVAAALHAAITLRIAPSDISPWRTLTLAAWFCVLLLAYFRLLAKAFSPALAEARLQALQARIRPHFLFNSLNAVLAIIRRDPKRAERMLEDLSDLFRVLMSDARQFVRLADEVSLLERYAELEQVRLGERLRVVWELDTAPLDALLPPLVLQPLLENAVYHGVEPLTGTGEVLVRIERRGGRVAMRIENPYVEAQAHRAGNRMALDNIRERLALFFDAEALLRTSEKGGRYCVDIEIPYRPEVKAKIAQ